MGEKKLFNFNFDEDLIEKIDRLVAASNNLYRDRTHFIILKLQEAVEKEIKKREREAEFTRADKLEE